MISTGCVMRAATGARDLVVALETQGPAGIAGRPDEVCALRQHGIGSCPKEEPGAFAEVVALVPRHEAVDALLECGGAGSEVAAHAHADQHDLLWLRTHAQEFIQHGRRRFLPLVRELHPVTKGLALARAFIAEKR